MNPARTILGTLIILLGLPILFGVIWAVGLTQAVVSPKFLVELPKKVIKQVPELVEDSISMALHHEDATDEVAALWVKAINKVETTPTQVMEEMGLLAWLEEELSLKLAHLGEIIENKRKPDDLYLDMTPLKKSLLSPPLKKYFLNVIENLPPCDEESKQIWLDISRRFHHHDELAPCRPDQEIIEEFVLYIQMEISESIPNEVEIFRCDDCFDFNFKWIRLIVSVTFLLFLFPGLLIVLGSLVAARDRVGFLKWCGISIMIGGLLPLIFIKIIERLAVSYIETDMWLDSIPYWSSVDVIFFNKIGGIYHTIIQSLFTPVGTVAGIVAVVGLILFAFSFLVHSQEEISRKSNGSDTTERKKAGE